MCRQKRRTRSLMDRALGYGPRGWGFDSLRVHQGRPLDIFIQAVFFIPPRGINHIHDMTNLSPGKVPQALPGQNSTRDIKTTREHQREISPPVTLQARRVVTPFTRYRRTRDSTTKQENDKRKRRTRGSSPGKTGHSRCRE